MATFIIAIVIYTTGIFLSLQSFSTYTDASYDTFYTWHFPLLSPLLLTWHPPIVTGIVHLSPRLLVNYPLCPPLLPCTFPPPKLSTLSGFPGPNVLLIRAHHKPSSQCTRHLVQHEEIIMCITNLAPGYRVYYVYEGHGGYKSA